jgi:hypothetical protein
MPPGATQRQAPPRAFQPAAQRSSASRVSAGVGNARNSRRVTVDTSHL